MQNKNYIENISKPTYTKILENGKINKLKNINHEYRENNKKQILLHSCCGPCSTSVIENLMKNYNVTVFFYNPNIVNEKEYERRKKAQIEVLNWFNFTDKYEGVVNFVDSSYDPFEFVSKAKKLSEEKEGGKRCTLCFDVRLSKTAEIARINKFDIFTTTLTVSPHKDYNTICSVAKDYAIKYSLPFLDENFKKKDGFKRSIDISKEIGIYRQNFCGCTYSVWDKDKNLGGTNGEVNSTKKLHTSN